MSAHGGALEAVERVLESGGEADDVLRQVVAILHERLGGFVRISFVEETVLVPGPAAGDETATTAFPIAFQGNRVADLEVGGELTEDDTRCSNASRCSSLHTPSSAGTPAARHGTRRRPLSEPPRRPTQLQGS